MKTYVEDPNVRRQFDVLERIMDEKYSMLSDNTLYSSDEYQEVIDLGKEAVPIILNRLTPENVFQWDPALRSLLLGRVELFPYDKTPNPDLLHAFWTNIDPNNPPQIVQPKQKPTLLVNFYGGPGSGKSSLCAAVFAELKFRGILAEIASEFAKDLVWEESTQVLGNQLYVLGHQWHRVWRLMGKVDVILTDSPLLLSAMYASEDSKHYIDPLVRNLIQSIPDQMHVVLRREKPYEPRGRMQTENEAKELDVLIQERLSTESQGNWEIIHTVSTREGTLAVMESIVRVLQGT